MIETGIKAIKPVPIGTPTTAQRCIVAEALRKAGLVRTERAEELAKLSATRNESAASLLGFLKDEPEIVDAMRGAAREHRQALYGS